MASRTGELTSDRLSLIVFAPAAASSRAADTELAGIHRAGRSPSSAGQLPAKPPTTCSEPAGLTPTATQRSPTGSAVSLYLSPSVLDLLGDGRVGDDRDRELAVDAARGGGFGAVGQCVTEEAPQDDAGDHHDDGHQRGDDAETDAAPTAGYAPGGCPSIHRLPSPRCAAGPTAAVATGAAARNWARGTPARGSRAAGTRAARIRPRRSSARGTRVRGIRDGRTRTRDSRARRSRVPRRPAPAPRRRNPRDRECYACPSLPLCSIRRPVITGPSSHLAESLVTVTAAWDLNSRRRRCRIGSV